jgi:hypothetical protein
LVGVRTNKRENRCLFTLLEKEKGIEEKRKSLEEREREKEKEIL